MAQFIYKGQTPTQLANPPRVILAHTASSGVAGGDTSSSTWLKRTLNTEELDTHNICTLTASEFTLPAGTYYIEGRGALYGSNPNAQHRLYNVSDASVILTGDSAYSNGVGVNTYSRIMGVFTITASKTLRLEYYVSTGQATVGLGVAASAGVTEVYARLVIEKLPG